jgi:hypothetical protein
MHEPLSVEPGVESVGVCECCRHETRAFRGFVFNHEGAFAVYFATYSDSHPELGVSMVVILRGWGEGADTSTKSCVALKWQDTETGPGCAVVDGASWVDESAFGRLLSRSDALASGLANEAFAVSDAVWLADRRLPRALTANPTFQRTATRPLN